MVDKRNGFWIRNYYYNENSKLMDNVNKEIVEFFKTVGFSLIEIKSSVFRIEESTLVFQTDHKDHTIDASTILYKDAEKILTQALQAQRDAGVEEERERARKVIEERLKCSELMLRELSGGNDMQGGDIDDQIDHETSAKVVLERLLQALTPPTK